MINNTAYLESFSSPARRIKGKVELYEGSTLLSTFLSNTNLKSFTVERAGESSKFFGFGVCQKITVKIVGGIDIDIEDLKGKRLKAMLGADDLNYLETFPTFDIYEVTKDEKTREIELVGYDLLYKMQEEYQLSDLNLPSLYSIDDLAMSICNFFDIALSYDMDLDDAFCKDYYAEGFNFDGTETVRRAMNVVAEATQSIYYIKGNAIIFKRLDKSGSPVYTMPKSQYFEFNKQPPRTLTAIAYATELGDNVISHSIGEGETQYVRDNSIWEMRSDKDTVVENALAAIGGLSITPFNCKWRGNPMLEIGDKIAIVEKDGATTTVSFLLNDTLSYTGGLSGKMSWEYKEQKETPANPASLGEALNYTFAKVDKINREITLVASETTANTNSISQIQMDTESISASITKESQDREAAVGALNDAVVEVATQVSSIKLESDKALLEFRNELNAEGVSKVDTGTGFTFDATGLSIEKDGSLVSTHISENGMEITSTDNGDVMLTVNDTGVDAENLRATTYLIIGGSRLENYGSGRTGCFWVDE